MKKRTRKAIENLLLALPCALQTCKNLSAQGKATGWRIFENLLRTYIDKEHKKSRRGAR